MSAVGPEGAPRVPGPTKRAAYEPAARLLTPLAHDPAMRRPASIVAGTALVLLRVVAGVVVLTALAAGWGDLVSGADAVLGGLAPGASYGQAALWFVLAAGGTVLIIEAVVAVFVYRGRNGARVLVMIIAVLSISTSFTAWWVQDQDITLDGAFLSLALDILLLLALSSRSAAAYARRNETR